MSRYLIARRRCAIAISAMVRDSNHLSEFGNKMLGEIFAEMWRSINDVPGVIISPPQYAAVGISRTF